MRQRISEIEIIPVKPQNGLVAFCSFVLFESLYCGSIAIFSRPNGSYRLVYPTKKLGNKDLELFYPITSDFGTYIEKEVINKFNEVMTDGRHYCDYNSRR